METSIHSWLSGRCFHVGLWDLWQQRRERKKGLNRDNEGRKEGKLRKTGANKQNKLSKALCWAGAGTGGCVCLCEAMWTEWRGLGQILGCPTHSWLMIQSWSTAQRTSRHGTPGCAHASVCERVFVSVCIGIWLYDWCGFQCAHSQSCSCTNKCVYVCISMCEWERKVGRSEIKQRLSVLHVSYLKADCDHLGHKEGKNKRGGGEQVAGGESKSCHRRLTVNPTLLQHP